MILNVNMETSSVFNCCKVKLMEYKQKAMEYYNTNKYNEHNGIWYTI